MKLQEKQDGKRDVEPLGPNNNRAGWDDASTFEEQDITNAYEEHNVFFKNVDNSQKAKEKRALLQNLFFRGYSGKMSAPQKKYDVKDKSNQTELKKGMENLEVSRGFLEMDSNNPMMAFANPVSESLSEPPYFETHIYESSHGSNIANVSQHSFVRFHATVYNRELRRMVRYVFAVGHHQRGLVNDYDYPSTIAMRKEVKYSDVQKGFAFINRYRINRNEDWKLFTTNCNRFAKSVAESMGFQDMAKLHDTVSCVSSFKKIHKAMYANLASGNKNLQFFSMEEFSQEEMERMQMPSGKGDVQRDVSMAKGLANDRKSGQVGVPPEVQQSLESGIGRAIAKELRVNSIEDLKKVKDEYDEAVDQKKFVWFKKKKQRQIAIYEAYHVMMDYLKVLNDNKAYEQYLKEPGKNISKEEYEAAKDMFRASIYKNLLVMADDLLLVTKGLKESSVKALKLKGDIMGYKAMVTNEGDVASISNKGFGNYHAYAMDKLMEEDIDAGIYYNEEKINKSDTTMDQAATKIPLFSYGEESLKKEKNLAVNGHFILQRIMEREGDFIDKLPTQYSIMPLAQIAGVFKTIKESLQGGAKDNQRLLSYMQMLVEKKAGYTSSAEVMAWTMVQFIIVAVKDLWKIRSQSAPISDRNSLEKVERVEGIFNNLYDRRAMQTIEKKSMAIHSNNSDMNSDSEYQKKFTKDEKLDELAGRETKKMEEIQKYINDINDQLKEYADSIIK